MSFLSLKDADREAMLAEIGVDSIDELFRDIPAGVRFGRPLDLEPPLTELELQRHLEELAARNVDTTKELSFLGAGIYDHYVPAEAAAPESELSVDVRGRPRGARIVKRPIYKREETG